jgi:hypothetical protein
MCRDEFGDLVRSMRIWRISTAPPAIVGQRGSLGLAIFGGVQSLMMGLAL